MPQEFRKVYVFKRARLAIWNVSPEFLHFDRNCTSNITYNRHIERIGKLAKNGRGKDEYLQKGNSTN